MPTEILELKVDSKGVVTGLKRAEQANDKFSRNVQSTSKKTGGAFSKLQGSIFSLKAAFVGLGVGFLFVNAIKSSIEFNATISNLSAITGATGKDLDFLKDKAKEFGETTTLSASGVAEAFKLIASAKPDLLESGAALAFVTKEAITLAEAANISIQQSAISLGSALNQYGKGAESATKFIDVLAAGAKFGASEIADTSQALKQAGTVAASAGISFQQLNASIQILAGVGLKGARAGVGLRNAFLLLQKNGIGVTNGIFNLNNALEELAPDVDNTTKLMEIFGTENVVAGQRLISARKELIAMTSKVNENGVALKQARTNVDNLQGDLKNLGSAFEGLQLAITEGADSPLRGLVQSLADLLRFMSDNIDVIISFTKALGTFFILTKIVNLFTKLKAGVTAMIAANNLAAAATAVTTETMVASAAATTAASTSMAVLGTTALTTSKQLALANKTVKLSSATTAGLGTVMKKTTVGMGLMGAAGAGLRGIMTLLGGPVGLFITAASALVFFTSNMKSAEERMGELNGEVDKLNASLGKLSRLEVAAAFDTAKDKASDFQKEIANAQTEIKGIRQQQLRFGLSTSIYKGMEKQIRNIKIQVEQWNEGLIRVQATAEKLRQQKDFLVPALADTPDRAALAKSINDANIKRKEDAKPENIAKGLESKIAFATAPFLGGQTELRKAQQKLEELQKLKQELSNPVILKAVLKIGGKKAIDNLNFALDAAKKNVDDINVKLSKPVKTVGQKFADDLKTQINLYGKTEREIKIAQVAQEAYNAGITKQIGLIKMLAGELFDLNKARQIREGVDPTIAIQREIDQVNRLRGQSGAAGITDDQARQAIRNLTGVATATDKLKVQEDILNLAIREGVLTIPEQTRALSELAFAKEKVRQASMDLTSAEREAIVIQRSEISLQQARDQADFTKGRITTIDLIKRQNKTTKASIELLKKEAAAAKAAGMELKEARINEQIISLEASLTSASDLVRGDFQDAFTDTFDSLIMGTKSTSDAFKDLAKSILASFSRVISQNLGESLANSLFSSSTSSGGGGGSSGFGGIIESALGAVFGGGSESGGGFAGGGSFRVGGSGGVDSQLVQFKASPNETVTVTKPDQKGGNGGMTVNNYFTISAPNGNVSAQSEQQVATAAGRGIQNAMRRNT